MQHKRRGNNVVILEKEPGQQYSNHAGIGFGLNVERFLCEYDLTGITAAFPSHSWRWNSYTWNILNGRGILRLTSWGLLYSILRANFDATASVACPEPPLPAKGDGHAVYYSGKRVIGLQIKEETVIVHFTNIHTGKQESLNADLVLGADGIHSTIRRLVNVPYVKRYAGYVVWRGIVAEKQLPPSTVQYFTNSITFNLSKRGYIVW